MNVVILHVLQRDSSGSDFGTLRIASPGLAPDDRVALWEGLPPPLVPDHPVLAPVALVGELDGRRAYAERIPNGVRLSEASPPRELQPWIVARVLEGLAVLHGVKQVHGTVEPSRVVVGPDGEVVLFGRGRRGGLTALDLIAAVSLFPSEGEPTLPGEDAGQAALEIGRRCHPEDGARLAAWAREHLPARPVGEQVVLTVGSSAEDSMDEIVPDLGPDAPTSEGLLDRWSHTTSTSGGESTPEVTDGSGTSRHRLASSLWTRMGTPTGASPERFAQVVGIPSRAVRSLLADEPPDVLPSPVVTVNERFAARDVSDDPGTAVGDQTATQLALPRVTESPAPVVRRRTTSTPGRRPVRWTELALAMALGGALVWLVLNVLRWFH